MDQMLTLTRQRGHSWDRICRENFELFQGRSQNACRKRHERLQKGRMEEDFGPDGARFEEFAGAYAMVREEFFGRMAGGLGLTGDSAWKDVETKVCSCSDD
jgi:hypothetical protein